MREEVLPLFPLNVVLFPGAHLPLHIFEERYRTLIQECAAQRSEFGINLAHEQRVADVGCTARVVRTVHRYDDGRMDIIVEGRRRYRLVRYEPETHPYAVGIVTILDGPPGTVDAVLARETRELYNRLITVVYKGSMEELPMADDRTGLSFVMAQKAGLDLAARQSLLEQDSENARLRMLHRYLTDVVPRLSRLEEVARIIGSDGYVVDGSVD
jgi:Lon protease-like protein